MQVRRIMLVMVFGAVVGCTERVNVCNSDSDCTDPAYPFCDVNGEYAESGHVAMSCSITPASCPIERCGCVAGLVTCNGDQLSTCNADGNGTTTETCALGCATDGTRCSTFEPSNGLSTQLEASADEPDRTLPDGAVVDTTTGMVTGAAGTIPSVTVAQSGGADIRVFIAHSWTISNVRIVGSLPAAFVAADEIRVTGTIDASADGPTPGPGASACESGGNGGARPTGYFEHVGTNSGGYPTYLYSINGAGGGGFGTAGGSGGVESAAFAAGAGGVANGPASLTPLRGGCDGFADLASLKGAGGGAIQLVAGRRVHLVNTGSGTGILHVGGGGGRAGALGSSDLPATTPVYGSGGGGSGGGILLEAPSVVLDDNAALLAAGGGGGGYGACANAPDGHDAPANAIAPLGGACPAGTTPATSGGAGATSGSGGAGNNTTTGGAGSGGGGSGRVRVNSASGQYMSGADAVVWGALTTGALQPR